MKGFLFLGLDRGLEVRDEKVRRGRWRHGGTMSAESLAAIGCGGESGAGGRWMRRRAALMAPGCGEEVTAE